MTSKFFTSSKAPTKKLDIAGNLANRFITEKIDAYMDELENVLKNEKTSEISWSRDEAKKVLGRQLALAYAFGFLDRTENRT